MTGEIQYDHACVFTGKVAPLIYALADARRAHEGAEAAQYAGPVVLLP